MVPRSLLTATASLSDGLFFQGLFPMSVPLTMLRWLLTAASVRRLLTKLHILGLGRLMKSRHCIEDKLRDEMVLVQVIDERDVWAAIHGGTVADVRADVPHAPTEGIPTGFIFPRLKDFIAVPAPRLFGELMLHVGSDVLKPELFLAEPVSLVALSIIPELAFVDGWQLIHRIGDSGLRGRRYRGVEDRRRSGVALHVRALA